MNSHFFIAPFLFFLLEMDAWKGACDDEGLLADGDDGEEEAKDVGGVIHSKPSGYARGHFCDIFPPQSILKLLFS